MKEVSVSPLISVIIPVFNAKNYIRKCLDSVTGSTLKDMEIICVDDGSTDGSLAILKEYESKDTRIKVLTQAQQYAGTARNNGLDVARGEYVHFLDADDWIDIYAYEMWYKIAKENHADVCMCMHYNIDIQTGESVPVKDIAYSKYQDQYLYVSNYKKDAEFFIFGVQVPWNKIYLRKFLTDNAIRFPKLICAEDVPFYFEVMYKAETIAIVRERWLYHTVNNKESLDGSDIRLANFDVEYQFFEIIWDMMKDVTDDEKRLVLKECIGNSLFYYRKSIGTKFEKNVKESLINYWTDKIPLLGDDLFEARWFKSYLSIIKNDKKATREVMVRPVDCSGNVKTFAFSFDEKYVKYFSVTLLSLIAHANPESRYEIIVFYDSLSHEKQEIVKRLLPTNFSIRFICVTTYVNEILGDVKSKVSSKQWDVSTFYDMLIPLLMPEYERVLYCDSDIVFKGCPDEIFNIPFDGKKLIAVKDTIQLAILKHPEGKYLQKQVTFINQDIGVQDLRYYFNGGVLLFNNRAIKREEYLDRALQALSFPVLPTVDQDALNFIFKNEVKIISQRFNFQYHLLKGLSDNDLNNSIALEYIMAGRDPVIVHYTTPDKPWKNPACALGSLFWKYARLSPFYEEILYENLTVSINESYELIIKKLKAEFEQKHKEIEKQQQRNYERIGKELNKLKQSRSYRIGRMLTFIPRKLRDFFK